MTELANTEITPQEPLSTMLDAEVTPKASGAGKVDIPVDDVKPEQPAKPESVRDSLEAELKKEKEAAPAQEKEDKDNKQESKAQEEEKEEVKPAKAEKSVTPEKEDDASERDDEPKAERKSEVRERPEPPARFLPKAKELWRSTPNEVQSEVSRLVKEHEAEVQQYKESHQFREELRPFEELGKKHGVSIKQALENYVDIERRFYEQPEEGFRKLLSNLSMQPQQAISHILKAFNVTPQALATHMSQNPQAYVAPDRPVAQQQQPRVDPEVNQLKQQLTEMRVQLAHQQYIEPFIQNHPRYYELEQDIAFFLQSGKIPANLSPAEKLAAAYDMAERINPSSNIEPQVEKRASPESRVDDDFNGTKSIKSSPGNVLEVKEPEKKMSMRELLEDELKRLKRA